MTTEPDEPSVKDLLTPVAFLDPSPPPTPATMPDEVWLRIRAALPGQTTVIPMRRRRPIRAIGGLIAASVAMLALSTVVLVDRPDTADVVASAPDIAQSAEITASGVNYTAKELRSQVRTLLRSAGIERPDRMDKAVVANQTPMSADLLGCLQGIRSTMGVQPLVVDRAGYESTPAAIVIVSLAFSDAGEPLLDVIVLDAACDGRSQTMLAHVVYSVDS